MNEHEIFAAASFIFGELVSLIFVIYFVIPSFSSAIISLKHSAVILK